MFSSKLETGERENFSPFLRQWEKTKFGLPKKRRVERTFPLPNPEKGEKTLRTRLEATPADKSTFSKWRFPFLCVKTTTGQKRRSLPMRRTQNVSLRTHAHKENEAVQSLTSHSRKSMPFLTKTCTCFLNSCCTASFPARNTACGFTCRYPWSGMAVQFLNVSLQYALGMQVPKVGKDRTGRKVPFTVCYWVCQLVPLVWVYMSVRTLGREWQYVPLPLR